MNKNDFIIHSDLSFLSGQMGAVIAQYGNMFYHIEISDDFLDIEKNH